MTEKKMSGKQKEAGAFNLSSFVNKADPAHELENEKKPQPAAKLKKAGKGATPKPEPAPKKKKPLLTERLQIRITKEEMEKVEKAAGLVPVSVFLRNHLKDSGIL